MKAIPKIQKLIMRKIKDKKYYKEKYKIGKREILVKTLILRVISTLITAMLVFAFTGSWVISGNIMWISFVLKTILYYTYEHTWLKFRSRWRSYYV